MPEGIPFSLTQGDDPTLDDLTVGGKVEGDQQGLSLYWTVAQMIGVNHSTSPVTPTGGIDTTTLADLFGVAPNAAAGGTNQATATLLEARTTVFVSVNPGAGSRLPPGLTTRQRTVFNASLNDILVWPNANETIEPFGVNDPVLVAVNGKVDFVCRAPGLWRVG